MKKMTLFLLLPLWIVMTGCVAHRYDKAMSEANDYWSLRKSPGEIDAAEVARLVLPFVNDSGIRYLTTKLRSKDRRERETATLLLVPVYQILIEAKSKRASSLLAIVEGSRYWDRVQEFSRSGDNPAITDYLMSVNLRDRKPQGHVSTIDE